MTAAVVADTHTIVWFLFDPQRLSPAARKAVAAAERLPGMLRVSTISLVELLYLSEKGRLSAAVLAGVEAEADAGTFTLVPVERATADAMATVSRSAVPDLPDRLIAASAVQLGIPLVTCDQRLLASQVATIW